MRNKFIQLADLPSMKKASSLLIFWNENMEEMLSTFALMTDLLSLKPFMLMNPVKYHPIDGVVVTDNVASLPEIAFWKGTRNDLVFLTAAQPQLEWHDFLTELMSFSSSVLNVKTIYTAGSFYKSISHKDPRELTVTYSSPRIKEKMARFSLGKNIDFSASPLIQRPSISAYLSWLCGRFDLESVNCWVSVPFYLSVTGDRMSSRTMASAFDKIFNLGLDLSTYDGEINKLYLDLESLSASSVDVADMLERIYEGDVITDEESQLLINEIRDYFLKIN